MGRAPIVLRLITLEVLPFGQLEIVNLANRRPIVSKLFKQKHNQNDQNQFSRWKMNKTNLIIL